MTQANGNIAQAEAEALQQQEQHSLTPSDARPIAPPPVPEAPAVPLPPAPLSAAWFEQAIQSQQALARDMEFKQQQAYAEWQRCLGVLDALNTLLKLAQGRAEAS